MTKPSKNPTQSISTFDKATVQAKATKPKQTDPKAKATKALPLSVSDAPAAPVAQPSQVSESALAVVATATESALAPLTDPGLDVVMTAVSTEAPSKAVAWRAVFTSALKSEQNPAEMKSLLESGIQDRLWAGLSAPDGKKFRSFETFCEAPLPFGLATSADEVQRFLNVTLGERAAKLLMAPEPAQGRRTDLELPAPEGEKSPPKHLTRQQGRLAAVNRAPEIVRKLCKEEILNVAEAAAFGPKNPSEEKKQKVIEVAAKLERLMADRDNFTADDFKAAVKNIVAEVNPPPVEILSSVHVGDPASVLPKLLKIHIPSNAGLALGLTSTHAVWASVPEGYIAMTKDDELGQDEKLTVILADDPEHNISLVSEKASKLDDGGILIVEAQPKRVDGVMQDVTGQLVFALYEGGFDWVDQVVVSRKPSAADRKSAPEQQAAIITHSTLLVFRKAKPEKKDVETPPTSETTPANDDAAVTTGKVRNQPESPDEAEKNEAVSEGTSQATSTATE